MLAKALNAQGPRPTPDGRGVLFVDTQHGSRLMYYDLAADSASVVLEESAEGQVLSTGHLVYSPVSGGIFVAPFDITKHKVIGAPVPVASGVQPNGGVSPFFVTRSGTLVYRAGVDPEYHLLLRDPAGRLDTLPIVPKVISYTRFSPDGRQLAVTIGSARGTNRHTALYDFARRSLTRFTLEGGGHAPTWSPDGRTLAFTAEGKDTDAEDLFVQPVDQSMPPRLVLRLPNDQHATAWPADSQLVFSTNVAPRILGGVPSGGSTWLVDPRASGAKAREYLNAPWGEYDVAVSPNGAWAAYTSSESGPTEVWVRAFPSNRVEGRWKISSGGGQRPRWSGDGRTLYYVTNDNASIRSVDVTLGSTLTIGASRVVLHLSSIGSAWDVDRTSGRMIVSTPARALGTRMIVLQGWRDQLARNAGTAK
jgi:serine/threonine-protein kinase